jgi:predicted O-linked N-acetylglucosamine transferase (SPINDLY family)
VLAVDPDNASALHLSGLVAYKTGRLERAVKLIGQAIRVDSARAAYHADLGNVLKDSGDRASAIDAYRRALALRPEYVEAHNNLGVVLQQENQLEPALLHFRRATKLSPDHFRAHFNEGNVLHALGRSEEALTAYQRALAANARYAPALSRLALVLQSLSRHEEAAGRLRQLLAIEPASAAAHADLALSLHQLNEIDAALAHYESSLALRPDGWSTLSNYCVLLQKTCAWTKLAIVASRLIAAIDEHRPGLAPSLLASLDGVTPAMQLAAARAEANALPPAARFSHSDHAREKSRLRIGYLSSDFREHATAYLSAEVFELHDRSRFEIFLYSYGPADESAMRGRLRRAADRFTDLSRETDEAAATRIFADGVDILVDRKGLAGAARVAIGSHRPAPVQVNWLGFPGTMGADWVDYIIADRHVIPDAQRLHYAEQVVRLPHCYQSNDRKRPRPPSRTGRAAHGLPNDAIVLCCFNQSYKITPGVFEAWMSVLRTVPRSVLWLLHDNARATDNLRAYATTRGVDPDRLIFARHAPIAEHLARYGAADLAIDTFPYTSHTTGSDALWIGCPLVTMQGETFASRVAASLLLSVGLPELVTCSLQQYEALVIALAGDPQRLQRLRTGLEAARERMPLFDTPRFTRALESAYERMWARWTSGEAAQAFDCEDD